MAFSLSFISYTISTIVARIEDAAGRSTYEKELAEFQPVDEEIANKVFRKVTEKSTGTLFGEALTSGSDDPRKDLGGETPETHPMEATADIYEDRIVTEYYLKYGYHSDDLSNLRLRGNFLESYTSGFPKNVSNRFAEHAKREQESDRLQSELKSSEKKRVFFNESILRNDKKKEDVHIA